MPPKPAKGTPKDLSKRIKSKGLKKLKWFCQMCQKQCGDQNGFKRHCESESHQRQLLLFAENQNAYLKEFSREFEVNFMHIFKYTYGGKRTRANVVYQEYIRDRGHVHMNATIWHTLGGFVRYLGSTGKCKIDEDEKGWHIQYIDKEEEMRKQKAHRADLAKVTDEPKVEVEPKEFVRENSDQKITFKLAPMKIKRTLIDKENFDNKDSSLPSTSSTSASIPDIKPSKLALDMKIKKEPSDRKKTALEELREEKERFEERKNRKDYWLHAGIIVKVVSKKASDKFYKAKGEVTKIIDKYTAEITLPSGDVGKFSQDQLETVIPAIGCEMLVVNGAYRGSICELEEILEDKFMLRLRISEGTRNGRIIELPYEDVSKLA
ncbi:Kin17-mid domain-containing protein [Aphelenchoides bicaudatus]|nr:Kin17-mid domain-containing protein [Aphelenchoides bicaudatus]